MSMGGGATQFGIDAEEVPAVLADGQRRGLVGLHIFAGSQNLRTDSLRQGVTETFRLADRLVSQLDLQLEHLNIGGGLGIPYFPGDSPVDLDAYGRHLAEELAWWRQRHPDTHVEVELGRYLVGEAGVFVSRVLERKCSRGRTSLVVDGGMHHHLAASGNFGQVIRRNYPVAVGNRMDEDRSSTMSVVGCLCTPLDLLADQVPLPGATDIGDQVVVFMAGAYGLTASPTAFLGHPAPAEVLV
jgi:diaminopimelate decarboxylase